MSKVKTLLLSGTLAVTTAVATSSMSVGQQEVTILTEEGPVTLKTSETKVKNIVNEANITLSEKHKVYPSLDEQLKTDYIAIKEGSKVKIFVDGQVKETISWALNVEELLKEQDITLNDEDIIAVPLDKELKDINNIEITRVDRKVVTESKNIPYQSEMYIDRSLPPGSSRTVIAGKKGVKEVTYEIVYHDGEEKERTVLEKEVVTQPKDAKVYANQRNMVASRGGSSNSAGYVGVASWYGSKFHGNGTASGETYDKNALTAAHRYLPFGTRVQVTFLQTGRSVVVRINDRGPFADNRIIDLSEAAAKEIGLRPHGVGRVEIKILD
ncbi:septal ring lytic transglycosylase RlpA family protein [Proteinivorax hydrogeniformans]|uniref:Probable endolytic peptidoglycan transglycosylase RlpA n=1 Tax=Proteinivorax hydrogeniformans TaxID=1826727 RepID=A0AAU8HTD1_9FIRM